MQYVELRKLRPVDNPIVTTPDSKDYEYGEKNIGKSLPVDYTVTGMLQYDVELGKSVIIHRDTRNGVKVSGLLTTSPVRDIEATNGGLIIHTDNSVYDMKWLETPENDID